MSDQVPTDAALTPQPLPFDPDWPPLVEAIRAALGEAAAKVYLVGGAVRDMLLRRPTHDFDLVSAEDGRTLARRIARALDGDYYPLDEARGVGRAIVQFEGARHLIDVAQFRGAGDLYEDLRLRDFTLNAMAVPLGGAMTAIIDPFGGLPAVRQKRLRLCAPTSFADDPLRVLRAVRQSVQFGLLIEPEARQALRAAVPRLSEVSAERVRDELMNMLGGPRPHVALRTLDALGILSRLVPEVEAMRGVAQSPPHLYDVWEHTLNVVEKLDAVLTTISPQRTDETAAEASLGMIVYVLDKYRAKLQAHLAAPLANGRSVRALLMLGALLHDSGKPGTRSVGDDGRIHFYRHEMVGAELTLVRATALALSNEESGRLERLVGGHMRPMMLHSSSQGEVTARAVHRFWRALGASGLDMCIVTLADYLGIYGPTLDVPDWVRFLQMVDRLLEGYLLRREVLVSPPPLLDGRALLDRLRIAPGPLVGRLLAALTEAQAVGEISTVEEAEALARRLAADQDGAGDPA
jgi:tRNA nucleotidyltransferase/poly(A) polymerase